MFDVGGRNAEVTHFSLAFFIARAQERERAKPREEVNFQGVVPSVLYFITKTFREEQSFLEVYTVIKSCAAIQQDFDTRLRHNALLTSYLRI